MATASCPDLSPRDQAILRDLDRVRLLTGRQLERLHFADLATANARGSARRRTLRRLTNQHLVTVLPRRVGGVRAGSSGLVYTLDSRAQRQRERWAADPLPIDRRIRRPWSIGWLFVAHTLAVAELYVRFRERERRAGDKLLRFDAEPRSWFPTDDGVLKPDAFAIYEDGAWEQHRWIEVDRGTESLPTVRRKLIGYARLHDTGATGPAGLLPSVLITVPDQHRGEQLAALAESLMPGTRFFEVQLFEEAVQAVGRSPP